MKKVNLVLILFCGFVFTSMSQTVTIGTQVWMTKNLDVSKFRNGDPIPEVKTDEEWENAGKSKQPAWCYYNNDPKNGEKYGKLYNWYAVSDPRGLAPNGYHIPSTIEWKILTKYLSAEPNAGDKMKSKRGWVRKGNGNNSSGFSGLPGGSRFDEFFSIGTFGAWWSSTEYESYTYDARSLSLYFNDKVNSNAFSSKENGFSVRCLLD